MNKRFKIFIAIFFMILSFRNTTYSQELVKSNAIEIHAWQRWYAGGHNSNCVGLTYVRSFSPIFDLCGEAGIRYLNPKTSTLDQSISYLSLGSRIYFKKSRTFNADMHFLYDNKKLSESDQKLGLKVGLGYSIPITNAFHVNLNTGLLLHIDYGMFYVGINLGHKF